LLSSTSPKISTKTKVTKKENKYKKERIFQNIFLDLKNFENGLKVSSMTGDKKASKDKTSHGKNSSLYGDPKTPAKKSSTNKK